MEVENALSRVATNDHDSLVFLALRVRERRTEFNEHAEAWSLAKHHQDRVSLQHGCEVLLGDLGSNGWGTGVVRESGIGSACPVEDDVVAR